VADIPELCQKVASVLDSQYCASLDRHVHVQDLVKKNIGTAKGLKSLRQSAASKSTTITKSGVTLAKGNYSCSLKVVCTQAFTHNTNTYIRIQCPQVILIMMRWNSAVRTQYPRSLILCHPAHP